MIGVVFASVLSLWRNSKALSVSFFMCRKVTSSTSNTAFILLKENFKCLSGNSSIKTYEKSNGYRIEFCIGCGSTVPNLFRDNNVYRQVY